MVDWNEIDRQLAELGRPPADVAGLLTRCLGADRSRDSLEQMLAELVQSAGEQPEAASPALTSHSTWANWPGQPEASPAPMPEAEAEATSEADDDDASVLSLAPDSGWPTASTRPSSVPAPAPTESLKALLDRELDPDEFPTTPSTPAPAVGGEADADVETADDDDFELLIEDEELLEIQEDDVEEVPGDDDAN